jgi:hypothetical protein
MERKPTMTNTTTKTYYVGVIERAVAYYDVEAGDSKAAAENWQDGEFSDRDDEALECEGVCSVREQQPDGSWRKVPRSEWEDETHTANTAVGRGAGTPTPCEWYMNVGANGAVVYNDHATIANVPIDLTDWEANAYLIAASPRLFAACRMVVERWERGDLAEAARACADAVAQAERHSTPDAAGAATKPHSVLLLYPDDLDATGYETYYAFVEASDATDAVAVAQRQAAAAQSIAIDDPADFRPLLVTEGHHRSEALWNQ